MLRVLVFLLLSLAVHLAVGHLLREPQRAAQIQAIAAPQVLRLSTLQLLPPSSPSPAVASTAQVESPVSPVAEQVVATPRPASPAPVKVRPAAVQAATAPSRQQAPQVAPLATAQANVPTHQPHPAPPAVVTEMAEVVSLQPSFRQPPQQPRYPTQARRRNQQGTVLLEVRLDERGEQRSLSVLRSSGIASLDHAAVEAVARWRFNPETSNGRAVPSRVQIPIQFALTASR